MARFDSPEALSRFVAETEQIMRGLGLTEAATCLNEVQARAYTTSSEWLGELGAAVRRIKAEGRLPRPIRQRLNLVTRAVRQAWPGL